MLTAHQQQARVVGVGQAGGEPNGHTCRDSQRAGHDGERAGELLAIAAAPGKKCVNGVAIMAGGDAEVVGELGGEPVLQYPCPVVVIGGPSHQAPGYPLGNGDAFGG